MASRRSCRFRRLLVLAAAATAAAAASGLLGSAGAVPRRNFPISIAVSPRGEAALVGNEERAGEVVGLPGLQVQRVLEAEKGSYARWHRSAPRVALFSGHLWIYSTEPWRLVHHTAAPLLDVTFHEQARLVGLEQIAEEQYSLLVLDLEPNPVPLRFPITDRRPSRIAYVGEDQVLVLGTDGVCTLWDIGGRRSLASASFPQMQGPLGVDALPERRMAAWISQETGKVGLVRLPSLEPAGLFEAHKPGYAETVRFAPGGKRLVTGAGYPDSSLRLWDTATGRQLGKKTGLQVLDVGFSPDGATLYVCDRQSEQPRAVPLGELLSGP